MALDIGIGFLDVIAVLLDGVVEPLNVIVGMVAHLMAFSEDAFIEFGVFAHVVAHHEEGGFDIELLQRVEDEGCGLRDRAVIEGQIDCLLVTVHSPVGFRIEPAEVDGGLLNEHLIIYDLTIYYLRFTRRLRLP